MCLTMMMQKADIEERYGQVKLSTIANVADKILLCAESCEGLHKVRIWKEDIVGAFNHFNITPSAAKWLSFKSTIMSFSYCSRGGSAGKVLQRYGRFLAELCCELLKANSKV